jgi:hypothetical protein
MHGEGCGAVVCDHEGTRRILRMSNSCWTKALDLNCLERSDHEHQFVMSIREQTAINSIPQRVQLADAKHCKLCNSEKKSPTWRLVGREREVDPLVLKSHPGENT